MLVNCDGEVSIHRHCKHWKRVDGQSHTNRATFGLRRSLPLCDESIDYTDVYALTTFDDILNRSDSLDDHFAEICSLENPLITSARPLARAPPVVEIGQKHTDFFL